MRMGYLECFLILDETKLFKVASAVRELLHQFVWSQEHGGYQILLLCWSLHGVANGCELRHLETWKVIRLSFLFGYW